MIDRDLLALLPTFLAVAEARSFTAAAGKDPALQADDSHIARANLRYGIVE